VVEVGLVQFGLAEILDVDERQVPKLCEVHDDPALSRSGS
jgi:hypothetical protein